LRKGPSAPRPSRHRPSEAVITREPGQEQLSTLIGHVYDASVDPSLWVEALQRAGDFTGGRAASLVVKDASRQTGTSFYDYGLEPHYLALYFKKYVTLDHSINSQLFANVGRVISTANYMAYDEFVETRYSKEWARPQGWVDGASGILEKTATSVAMFTVFRHEREGLVDDFMRRRMRLIVPHIRRAVLIGKAIDMGQAKAAAFADVLDGMAAGAFLVDEAARIVHANNAGQLLLDAGDIVKVLGGRLSAGDAQADRVWRETLAAAADGDLPMSDKGAALTLTAANGERYVAHVLPLTAGARRRIGRDFSAVAVLFVRKAGLDATAPLEILAKTYRLTPTELRVLLAIVEVGGAPDVAEALGIGEATVKTHLSRLYEKTGMRRQADLVRLVAGYASPLLG
jgi:DNA-binding CsgD family transcriptional regulator